MASGLVIGYDGSDCARAALDAATELARELGEGIAIVFGYAPPGTMGEEYRAHREAVRRMAEEVTAEGAERARAAGVEAEVMLVGEHPVEALLSAAAQRDARAVVVGTYGEHPVKGAILGSTPYRLLHISEIPVLVVPAP
jgi:nucleotide-binding universal stress UspA family protein